MYVYSLMGEWAFDVCAVYLHMCSRYTSVCKGPFTNDVSTLLKAKEGRVKNLQNVLKFIV